MYEKARGSSALVAWTVIGIGMLFYCYAYFLRISPSVMMHDLLSSFHITATQFGTLAAFYYFAYTPMQLPVGLILDRFGARIVLFIACLVSVLGVLLFIMANSLHAAEFGRLLIGLSTAFAYVTVLKLATIWLPPNRFATVAGLTTAFGMAAAIFSDMYLTKLVQSVGYKSALYSSLIFGVVLSIMILLLVRSRPKVSKSSEIKAEEPKLTTRQLWEGIKSIVQNPQMWLIGIIGALFYMPASVFLDVWGIPYLKSTYHLTPEMAASVVSMVFVGWIISSPMIGAISDKIGRRRRPLLIAAVVATILFSAVIYLPGLSSTSLFILFFFIGVFCGAHPLCFAIARENNPTKISGTAVSVTNTLIMLGGVIFQPAVGKLLDLRWSGTMLHGIPFYSPSDYRFALSILPIALFAAIFLTLFIRETYCQVHERATERSDQRKNTFGALSGSQDAGGVMPGASEREWK